MFHILETRPTKVRWCWLARERGTSTALLLVSTVFVLRVATLGGCRNPARCGTPCTCALCNTTSAATSLRYSSESRGLAGSGWAGGSAASTNHKARRWMLFSLLVCEAAYDIQERTATPTVLSRVWSRREYSHQRKPSLLAAAGEDLPRRCSTGLAPAQSPHDWTLRAVKKWICATVLLLLLAGHTATLHGVGGVVVWSVVLLVRLGRLAPEAAPFLGNEWLAHVTWSDDAARNAVHALCNIQVRPLLDAFMPAMDPLGLALPATTLTTSQICDESRAAAHATLQDDAELENHIINLFNQAETSDMADYWKDFFTMTDALMQNVHTVHICSWDEYVSSACHSAVDGNIRQYQVAFLHNDFTQSITGNPYSNITWGMWIECTMNKGSKIKSGWLSILQNENQLLVHSRNVKAQIRAAHNTLANRKEAKRKHTECNPKPMQQDEQCVQNLVACMKEFDSFPFNSASPTLPTLQSAIPANDELVEDFNSVYAAGEEKLT
ncbi:hypothetical protein GWK47_019337 [Chionoecetes opilio]|uniref:Uncharacterized protein n=1 Tax=Chionoecetes opilio TaxID=41210 RepID=A0A8J4XUI8_CHIOP|nr:hypothetical protein GWK47_019337 [Chionoecetes opilio]